MKAWYNLLKDQVKVLNHTPIRIKSSINSLGIANLQVVSVNQLGGNKMPKKVKLKLKSFIKNYIIKAPNVMLNNATQPLNEDNNKDIVRSFWKRSMKHRKGAVGIAGNQIHMPYRIFIAQLTTDVWKIFINPTIPRTSESAFFNS